MKDKVWFVPKTNDPKSTIQIRIVNDFIKISQYFIDKYCINKPYVRISFTEKNNQLTIMPTDDEDNLGYKIWKNKKDLNYRYIYLRIDIRSFSLKPANKKDYYHYQYRWDENEKYLIVNNVGDKK